ncbi:MAG: SpoIID/LytB domain-containing protein, partial [Solirubrobacteraceae bacterium]|nr:SpoIID/LytB domain-containing protein [Solirubrobacteraceae bacterium]
MTAHALRSCLRTRAVLPAAGLVLLAAAPAGHAATTIVAKGAGYGHGIGMSQYGAYGQAKAGRSAAQILATYYLGTELAKGDTNRQIRVLLRTASRVTVRGAASLAGTSRKLTPSATYVLQSGGGKVTLSSSSGKRIASATTALRLQAAPGGAVTVGGKALNGISSGRYRGAVELRGTNVINQVALEDYVRGVVSGESPSSWPAAALQAQAIAARTYAVTTSRNADFDQYPDVRSQVYRGVAGEVATTNAAVAATAGQLVTYKGTPITTFFFSTSGGQTENVENSFLGSTPKPYLRSVKDPWDTASPKHRWQIRYTRASLQKKLGGWSKGTLRSIDVIKRGVSPRVIRADIVGSRGRTTVTGPQLLFA